MIDLKLRKTTATTDTDSTSNSNANDYTAPITTSGGASPLTLKVSLQGYQDNATHLTIYPHFIEYHLQREGK